MVFVNMILGTQSFLLPNDHLATTTSHCQAIVYHHLYIIAINSVDYKCIESYVHHGFDQFASMSYGRVLDLYSAYHSRPCDMIPSK